MSRNLYKKKGIGGVDPKDKRRLRRSLHQKEVRDQGFLSRRVVDDEFSPLREQPKETARSRVPVPRTLADEAKKDVKSKQATTKAKADLRREMLTKWKEEKELKRKVEQMKKEKSRPSFKVRKIEYERISYLPTKKQDGSKKIPTSNGKTMAAEKQTKVLPVLRRSSRLASKDDPKTVRPRSSSQTEKLKPEDKKRPVRNTHTTSTNRPAASKMALPTPVHKTSKKPVPKIKQSVMPTMSSFTFRKEINLKLTSALPIPKRTGKPGSTVNGAKTAQKHGPLKMAQTSAVVKMETKVGKNGLNRGKEVKKQEVTVSKKDVDGAKHYQSLMDEERERLTGFCSTWGQVMEDENLPESVHGDIRSAIGKAQLLMDQRFKQFGGLVEQCRLGQGEKRTHTTDLQGFWEMVGFQIEDVNKMFDNLTELQKNGWKQKEEDKPVVKSFVKKQTLNEVKKPTGDKNAARERLAAAKAAMKARTQTEVVVFDAGFFKVESPAKEKEPHCAAGSSANNTPSRRSHTTRASPLLRKSTTPSNTPKRTSLDGRQQNLLRAVLQASHTPKMSSLASSPVTAPSGNLFHHNDNEIPQGYTTPSNKGMCTRLADLGVSSAKSSVRKRRRSQRTKLTKDEDLNKENGNDISGYLAPTLPVVDLNIQAEEMMETEPAVQLRDLGKKTPLANQTEKLSDSETFSNVTVRRTPGRGMTPRSSKSKTPKTLPSLSPEMEPSPSKIPKKRINTPSRNVNIKEESNEMQEGDKDKSSEIVVVSKEDIEGATHYQSVMDGEKERLTGLCSSWSHVLEKEKVPDDVHGDIRSAIGKAQLLMDQRFKQFGGLVEQCRLGQGEKRTHTTDLQGFWEMVGFQIEDVDKMFTNLSEMKDNKWKRKEEPKPVMKKVVKKKTVPKVKKPTGDKNAARERLAAAKAAMKARTQTEVVVFDAGFFKVESPAKEKEPHCAAGSSAHNSPLKGRRSSQASPLLRRSLTPRSSKRTSVSGKEHDLLRVVLKASCTPKLTPAPSPDHAGSLFTPEQSPSDEVCTRLRDLGLSSGKSSTRKRRRSQRRKSTKENVQQEEKGDKENEDDLSSYLMPSVPFVDTNFQAKEMMKTNPTDELIDLGKRTPLMDRNSMTSDSDDVMKPPLCPFNPSPVGDLFDSPKLAPRRSTRLRAGRVSAFTPPRRSFANVPPSVDLISFD